MASNRIIRDNWFDGMFLRVCIGNQYSGRKHWGQTHIRNGSTRIPYPINTVYNKFIGYTECKTPSDKKIEFFLNLLHVNVTYHVCLNV